MNELQKSHFLIYQSEDGKIKIDVRFENETVWLTQAMLVELFQSSKANVSEHIKHIFEEEELSQEAVVRNYNSEQLPLMENHTKLPITILTLSSRWDTE